MKYLILLFLTSCTLSFGTSSKPLEPTNAKNVCSKCRKIPKDCQEYQDDFDNVFIFDRKDGKICWMKRKKKGSYCYE